LGRILAIDYGKKRCGIASTDNLKMIANALQTVETQALLDFLKNYCKTETVEAFVIGKPMRMHYEASDIEADILEFIKKLNKEFPTIQLFRHDERFTSKMAQQTMIGVGTKKSQRKNKALLDVISATIILQSFLDSSTYKKTYE